MSSAIKPCSIYPMYVCIKLLELASPTMYVCTCIYLCVKLMELALTTKCVSMCMLYIITSPHIPSLDCWTLLELVFNRFAYIYFLLHRGVTEHIPPVGPGNPNLKMLCSHFTHGAISSAPLLLSSVQLQVQIMGPSPKTRAKIYSL